MKTQIHQILTRVGARDEIASECGVEPIAVYRWGQNGSIPSRHLAGVLRVAKRNKSGVLAQDLIAAHDVSPSPDVSRSMVSCPLQDVGTPRANVKGNAA